MRKLKIISAITVFLISCETGDNTNKNYGEAVLTTERILTDTYRSVGFSFREGRNVPFPVTPGGIVPDIIVTNETDIEGNITGANFTSSNNNPAFHLEGTFRTLTEALAWFDQYTEVTTEDFSALANLVACNQVWTIQTVNQKYAKLVIKDIQIKTDSPVSDYVEVTVEYYYQPDGSRILKD